MAYWFSTRDSKSVDCEFESQSFPLEVFHPRRYKFLGSLRAGDSLRLRVTDNVRKSEALMPKGTLGWVGLRVVIP